MAAYPTLSTGVSVHRPWEVHRGYKNTHVDMRHGYRFSYNVRATPLTPWVIQYANLSDADWATLVAFWEARKGSYEAFDFTDPDTSTPYSNCRFDQESLDVRHVNYNENAVTVRIHVHA